MANEEQLEILKQGMEVWNKWRKENRKVNINLDHASLRGANLSGYNLNGANLNGADLHKADLSEASLTRAHLSNANLRKADLREANLSMASLHLAHLSEADLRGANLAEADLRRADILQANLARANLLKANLRKADLSRSSLMGANLLQANFEIAKLIDVNFSEAILIQSNFSKAILGHTVFGNTDLSKASKLDEAFHRGPSTIGIDTIAKSKGKIPAAFLRGCGLSDWEIEIVKLYNPDLSNDERNRILYKINDLQASQAIQSSPLFISYSHGDRQFVDKIGNSLTQRGIRYWRDIHELKAGRIEKQIELAIRQNPTVLLVLSEHSLNSDWVEHEVRSARTLEKETGLDVLCPVALDDSWKSSRWPKRIMEQIMEYNILDFSAWKDDSKFDNMFRKLIDGLELFYKG
jgi:uncharacterized protein YjbI with pentapeptide repeats